MIRKYQRKGDYHKYFDLKIPSESQEAKKVGGILFLMSSRCGKLEQSYELGEEIGAYAEVTHTVGNTKLTTGATYWPNKTSRNEGEGSLWRQAKNYMIKTNVEEEEPIDYIKETCKNRVIQANKRGHALIIMGDMNEPWEDREDVSGVKRWASANGLVSSRQSGEDYGFRVTRYANVNKRTGGTELDHILTNWRAIPLQYQDGYDDRVENNLLSDHILQRVILHIPQMERTKHRKQAKRIRETIDIKITKEKYKEGEETAYTGKADIWKKRLKKYTLT